MKIKKLVKCLCHKILIELEIETKTTNSRLITRKLRKKIEKEVSKLIKNQEISRWRKWSKHKLKPDFECEEIYLCPECAKKVIKLINKKNSYNQVYDKIKKRLDEIN